MIENKLVRTNKEIIDSSTIISCTYDSCINAATNLRFGDVTSDCIDIEVRGSGVLTPGEVLTYYRNNALVGQFVVQEPTRTSRVTYKFTAFDNLIRLEKDVGALMRELKTQFPMALGTLVSKVCECCGVVMASPTFPRSDLMVNGVLADSITGRQIISWAAEIAGRYCKANTRGQLEFSWYTRRTDIGISAGGIVPYYRNSIPVFIDTTPVKTVPVKKIERVRISQSDKDVGVIYPNTADGNTYSVNQNALLSGLPRAQLESVAKALYEQLKDVTYTPLAWESPDGAQVSVGDVVDVFGHDGNWVCYVMRAEASRSGCRYSCTGDPEQGTAPMVASQKYTNMYGKMLEIGADINGLSLKASEIENEVDQSLGKIAAVEIKADAIRQEVAETTTTIQGLSQEIQSSKSQVEQLSDEMTLKFTQSNERIEDVNGEMQSRYDEISKIIRATLDGIFIGQSNSDTQLHLDNDIIEILVASIAEVTIDHSGLRSKQVTVREIHQGGFTWGLSGPNDNILTLS